MSKSLGTAVHVYDDLSKHELRVEISAKGTPGFVVSVGEPNYFNRRWLDWQHTIHVAGAEQARTLAALLEDAAARLEKRGEL